MPLIIESAVQRMPVILFRVLPGGEREYRLAVLQQLNATEQNDHLSTCYDLDAYAKAREEAIAANGGKEEGVDEKIRLQPRDNNERILDQVHRGLWVETNATPSGDVLKLREESKNDPDGGDARVLAFYDASIVATGTGQGQRRITINELKQYPSSSITAINNVMRKWDAAGDANRP